MKSAYLDFYMLPLPKKNLAKYKTVASKFGKIAREYGATMYYESVGDDLTPKGLVSFKKAANPKPNETVIAAVVGFKSRKHRDGVMKKMMKDKRVLAMSQNDPISDMSKMYYGGFKTIVEA